MNWISTKLNEPIEPSFGFGKSNHLLVYSEPNDCWFEAVYDFDLKTYLTLDGEDLEDLKITHFCEEIPLPEKKGFDDNNHSKKQNPISKIKDAEYEV